MRHATLALVAVAGLGLLAGLAWRVQTHEGHTDAGAAKTGMALPPAPSHCGKPT